MDIFSGLGSGKVSLDFTPAHPSRSDIVPGSVALGNSKGETFTHVHHRHVVADPVPTADIVKIIDSQPDLAAQLRRVRGGYLKIQGTWMPYEIALRLARR